MGVQTVHSSSLSYNNKKVYWPYILIIAVMLKLADIIYFVVDKNTEPSNTAAGEGNITDSAQPPSETMNTSPSLSPAAVRNTYESAGQEINIPDKSGTTASVTASDNNYQAATEPESPAGNTYTGSTQSSAAVKTDMPEIGTEIIEFHELPESIRQQLPAIIISAHVYSSNPLQRSIVVNNNFMEEGEYVLDGLILHEITPDGAIFNYQETMFHLGVISGWQ